MANIILFCFNSEEYFDSPSDCLTSFLGTRVDPDNRQNQPQQIKCSLLRNCWPESSSIQRKEK